MDRGAGSLAYGQHERTWAASLVWGRVRAKTKPNKSDNPRFCDQYRIRCVLWLYLAHDIDDPAETVGSDVGEGFSRASTHLPDFAAVINKGSGLCANYVPISANSLSCGL